MLGQGGVEKGAERRGPLFIPVSVGAPLGKGCAPAKQGGERASRRNMWLPRRGPWPGVVIGWELQGMAGEGYWHLPMEGCSPRRGKLSQMGGFVPLRIYESLSSRAEDVEW